MICIYFIIRKMSRRGPQDQMRNSRYMGVVAKVRQQQELACLPHPAIGASAALFEEDLGDSLVIFSPHDPTHVVIGYDEEGELKASVELLAEGEDPPEPKRTLITYIFLNESGEPAPLKLTMKEGISQSAKRVTSFTTHIVARSRISPHAAEPTDTSPVIDVEALSDVGTSDVSDVSGSAVFRSFGALL